MPGNLLLKRLPRHFVNTITFTGLTGAGLSGETVAVATVTGRILIVQMGIHCTTALTGATATISLGTTTTVAGLIAVTTSTLLLANTYWNDPTPQANVAGAIVNQTVNENIIMDCLTANTGAGVLEFSVFWLPMSSNGNLA